MVAHCCRFLCYFCRISRHNQGALFDRLSYLLENSSVGLGEPAPPLLLLQGFSHTGSNIAMVNKVADKASTTTVCHEAGDEL